MFARPTAPKPSAERLGCFREGARIDMPNALGPTEVPGLAAAIDAYGCPAERLVEYEVSKESLLYWQRVAQSRPGEVVLVLRRRNGRYLVHTKEFYPQGTYRLMTGGIEPGEDLLQALEREVREETGLQVSVERFLAIIHHRFRHVEQTVRFVSHIFLIREHMTPGSDPSPCDGEEQISGFRETDLDGLLKLARQLEALPDQWRDWGRFRASVHRVAWETIREGDGRRG